MKATSFITVLGFVWLAVTPVCALASQIIMSRWITQETPRNYWAMGGMTLGLIVTGAILSRLLHMPFAPKIAISLAGWAALGGWYGGPLAVNLWNRVGVDALPQPVQIEQVGHYSRQLVRLRVDGGGFDGVTFICASSTWLSAYQKKSGPSRSCAAVAYQGRLKLWWIELR